MKVFHCDHCEQLVFFENTHCVTCGHQLAYLPDLGVIGSLDAAGGTAWKSPLPRAADKSWRLCDNYTAHDVCNWAVAADDPNPLCVSCRLTRTIPALHLPDNRGRWYKLEVAKRRLVYSLLAMHLPVRSKDEDPAGGMTFEFLADPTDPAEPPVLTGHADGVITINIAEADDDERERRRVQMREPYRTLLGHVRHEIGHYYWDRLVRDDADRLAKFRALFGDERADYAAALKRHYETGAAPDWPTRCVTAYASVHPWEDWAETWAHYLHLSDTLEIAAKCGLSIRPSHKNEPSLKTVPDPVDDIPEPFDDLIASWYPLTYLLNNLNRGLGLPDPYPFVLPTPAVDKLRFVHDTIAGASTSGPLTASGEDSGDVIRQAIHWMLRGFPNTGAGPTTDKVR